MDPLLDPQVEEVVIAQHEAKPEPVQISGPAIPEDLPPPLPVTPAPVLATDPVSDWNVVEEGKKSVWVYPYDSNDPFVYFVLTPATDFDEIRKLLASKMGVIEKGVAKITFICYVGETQYVIPLTSLKIFCFENMSHESEFCFRIQNKDKTGGYAANPSDPWHDDVYFDSYAWMQIHWEMLSDYKRCQAYYHALERFSEDIKGKVVMDVGCGTGILSVYAMKCGAKKVYAIDASSIVLQAEQILNKNNCDGVVELIHGKLEEIILPVKEVDVIVSEWMGYFLLCESMLETVIYARDKWLAPGGKMFPCEAKLYLVPVNYDHYYTSKVKFFEQPVDGVDVSPLLPYAAEEFTTRTLRCFDLPVHEILSEPEIIKSIDVYTVTKNDCRRTHKKFKFAVNQNQNYMFKWVHSPKGHAKQVSLACSSDGWVSHPMSFQDDLWRVSLLLSPGTHQYKFIVDGVWMHDKFSDSINNNGNVNNVITINIVDRSRFNGFGSWFDVTFKGSNAGKEPIVLSTDPRQGYQTCWKQDVCLYGRNIEFGGTNEITGSIQVEQMKANLRHFKVSVGCNCNGDYNYRYWTV